MAKVKTKEVKTEKKKAGFMEVLTGIWLVAMIVVFPLYFQDAYGDMLDAKYGFFLVVNIIYIVAFIIWALIAKRPKSYIQHMKSFADEDGKWFSTWFKNTFNALDLFILGFWIVAIISTLLASPYVYQAFFGNEGRWMGLLAWSLIFASFFIASRYFKYKRGYIIAQLIVALFMSIWAITDYFNLDILKFKYYMHDGSRNLFVTTIGNIDSYCGYAAIPMALSGMLLILSKEKIISRIFYWLCFAVTVLSMITSTADNAFLAMLAFFALAPIVATKTRVGIRRYLLLAATLLSANKLAGYWDSKYSGIVVGISGVGKTLANNNVLTYIMIGLWVLVAILYIYDLAIKKTTDDTPAPKWVFIVWLVLLIVGLLGTITVFIIANSNAAAIPQGMDAIKNYLVFGDEWGTFRGYIWERMIKLYGMLPFIQKLFGAGPETAGIYMFNTGYYDIAVVTGMMYDSPHNEWIQILFTMGIFGLIAYLGSLITPLVMALKRNTKWYFAFVMGVGFICICHLAEAFVNISTPIDIPIIFAFIAMAQSLFRSKE